MQQVRSIQYLRGIAAILVVGFYFRGNLNDIYPIKNFGDLMFISGSFGVDLFFMISGFIIALSTAKSEDNMLTKYVVKRFFRIYPLFIITLAIFYLFISNEDNFSFWRSALLIQADYSQQAPFFGGNMIGQAWTLTYEIYFYLIFFVAMSISHKYRSWIASFMLAVSVFSLQLYFNGSISMEGDNAIALQAGMPEGLAAFLRFTSSPMLIEFIFGMMVYELRNVISSIPKINVIAVISCSLVFCFYFAQYKAAHGPFNYGLWAILLIATLVAYEMKNEIKEIKMLSFFGDISYSLYLTHIAITMYLDKFGANIPIYNQWVGMSRLILLFIITITTAYIFYNVVERPFIRLSRSIISCKFPALGNELSRQS